MFWACTQQTCKKTCDVKSKACSRLCQHTNAAWFIRPWKSRAFARSHLQYSEHILLTSLLLVAGRKSSCESGWVLSVHLLWLIETLIFHWTQNTNETRASQLWFTCCLLNHALIRKTDQDHWTEIWWDYTCIQCLWTPSDKYTETPEHPNSNTLTCASVVDDRDSGIQYSGAGFWASLQIGSIATVAYIGHLGHIFCQLRQSEDFLYSLLRYIQWAEVWERGGDTGWSVRETLVCTQYTRTCCAASAGALTCPRQSLSFSDFVWQQPCEEYVMDWLPCVTVVVHIRYAWQSNLNLKSRVGSWLRLAPTILERDEIKLGFQIGDWLREKIYRLFPCVCAMPFIKCM